MHENTQGQIRQYTQRLVAIGTEIAMLQTQLQALTVEQGALWNARDDLIVCVIRDNLAKATTAQGVDLAAGGQTHQDTTHPEET